MSASGAGRISQILHSALMRVGAERERYLADACAGDEALRREVESLLAEASATAGFLERPALDGVGDLLGGWSETPASLIGRRLGFYQVTDQLGVGGMGEVYRARDTKLGREVAIKILPREVAADPDCRSRLEREARLLAALNHPFIATIHGFEDFEGTHALILELVEGPTLAERLEHGPLPLTEALPVARQIAEALEAAHEKGIIHRDLKPANIKITPQGRVKVLDFGLAKMRTGKDAAPDLSQVPTMMSTGVRDLAVAGTPSYMSPEQARGEVVERTCDNWAFGCVLFEMLTGSVTFPGRTIPDIISGVLTGDPHWDQLPADTPLPVRLLLRRCLQKDGSRRLQFIGDARVEIDQLLTDPEAMIPPSPALPQRKRRALVGISALAALLALTAIPAVRYFRTPPPVNRRVLFEFAANGPLKISPDGQQLAYGAPAEDGRGNAMWVRPLNSLTPRTVPGTEGADSSAFGWSWDSRSIVFAARAEDAGEKAKLKRVDLAGGASQTLADLGGIAGASPSWGRSDVIVFVVGNVVRKVSASGGETTDVTKLAPGEFLHMWPSFLPDGRHFLYHAWSHVGGSDVGATYVGSLDSPQRTRVMDSMTAAVYARPGYLLFAGGDALLARPFDVDRLQLTGPAVTVADNIVWTAPGRVMVNASDDGTLVYRQRPASPPPGGAAQWEDRSGSGTGTVCGGPGIVMPGWRLAPDGRHAAAEGEAGLNIWVCDIDRNQSVRLTSDDFFDGDPVWSPDGTRVLFQSFRSAGFRDSTIYEKAANGATAERALLPAEPGTFMAPLDWSLDGKWILFSRGKAGSGKARSIPSNRDLWLLPSTGDSKPHPFLASQFDEAQASISPDGRFVAYVSNEIGKGYDVIVQSFPDPSRGKWPISTNGGCCPRWKRDGGELYYINSAGRIVSVHVKTVPAFEAGPSTLLGVAMRAVNAFGSYTGTFPYDVAGDGERFLVMAQRPALGNAEPGPRPFTVVLNWTAALKH